jgi:type IV pilus assembly protein PilY1
VAFKYWATDLQTGDDFANDLRPVMTVTAHRPTARPRVAPSWNPANNPATWQHMVTDAIGFGEAANITDPLWSGSSFAGTNFAGIVDGSRNWPAVNTSNGLAADLWHATVNSRGRMFTASNQAAVTTAFQSILSEIISQNVASGGAASSFVMSGENFRVVRAGYTSAPTLRGTLEAYGLNTTTGAVSNLPAWEGQAKLAALSDANATNRVVLTAASPAPARPSAGTR